MVRYDLISLLFSEIVLVFGLAVCTLGRVFSVVFIPLSLLPGRSRTGPDRWPRIPDGIL